MPGRFDAVQRNIILTLAALRSSQAGLLFLIVSAIFSYGIGFISQIALAHFISKEQVGYVSFGLSLLGIFGFLGLTGLSTAAIGPISRNYVGVYRKAFLGQLGGSAALSCVALAAAYLVRYKHPNEPEFFSILLVLAVLGPWIDIPVWRDYLVARNRFGLLLAANVVISLLSLIALVGVGFAGGNATSLLVAKYLPVAAVVLGACLAIFWKLRDRRDSEAGWFKYGLLRSSFSIIGLVSANLEKLLVGIFISFEALASLAYAERFYAISRSMFRAIEQGYSPRIAAASDGVVLRRLVHRHARLLATLLIVWALGLIVSLPVIVKMVLPPGYEDVVRLGQMYMLAWSMSIPSILLSPIIWTRHLGRADLRLTMFLHLTRLVSMGVFLATLGVAGLPISRAITNLVNFLLLRREVHRFLRRAGMAERFNA